MKKWEYAEQEQKRMAKRGLVVITIVLIAVLLGFFAASAEGQEISVSEPSDIAVTTTLNAWSQYFGQNGSSFYDEPVLQPEVTLGFGDHWSLNLWGSQGVDNGEVWRGFDDEFDVTLNYAHNVGGYNLTYGVAYFALVESVPGDIIRPTFEISRDFEVSPTYRLTPYSVSEVYSPTRGGDPKKGAMQRVGVRHTWGPSRFVWVTGRTGVFYDTGSFGFGEGFLAEWRAALNWRAFSKISIALPSLKCASGLTTGDRHVDCAYGLSMSVSH